MSQREQVDPQMIAYCMAQVQDLRGQVETLGQQVKAYSAQIDRLEYVIRQVSEEQAGRTQLVDHRIKQLRQQMQLSVAAVAVGATLGIGAVALATLS